MNGQWLGSRSIRTNWATRKPPATKAEREYSNYFLIFLSTSIAEYWPIDQFWQFHNSNKISPDIALEHHLFQTRWVNWKCWIWRIVMKIIQKYKHLKRANVVLRHVCMSSSYEYFEPQFHNGQRTKFIIYEVHVSISAVFICQYL